MLNIQNTPKPRSKGKQMGYLITTILSIQINLGGKKNPTAAEGIHHKLEEENTEEETEETIETTTGLPHLAIEIIVTTGTGVTGKGTTNKTEIATIIETEDKTMIGSIGIAMIETETIEDHHVEIGTITKEVETTVTEETGHDRIIKEIESRDQEVGPKMVHAKQVRRDAP